MGTGEDEGKIAYFTMEIGLEPDMKTYSGGLGILAGDTMRSFADLEIPAVGVTQLNDKGYGSQELDEEGNQTYSTDEWNPKEFLELLDLRTTVKIENTNIKIRAWKREVESFRDYTVPVLFLDTNFDENEEKFRDITSRLYGGDQRYRFWQEIVLGIGGVRILKKLGYDIEKYHMNESHSSLLTLELLKNHDMDKETVKDLCVFTTHTPEGSAHDEFSYDLVKEVLGEYIPISVLKDLSKEDRLHMTILALNLSSYVNAVSKRHEEVSREMFPDYYIESITNGVHIPTWVSKSFQEIFDEHAPGWRKDPYKLKHAVRIPEDEIWEAHLEEKEKLIDQVNLEADKELNSRVFTVGFARRATPYKRADLLFRDKKKLLKIAREGGDFQVLFTGKAHPKGEASKEMISKIVSLIKEVSEDIKMAYLEDYDIEWAKLLTSGVDLWLNNPERGREACGTSGMKAACNGIPQLGTLDGWWIEGHLEDVTGWKIGLDPDEEIEEDENINEIDASDLYEKLDEYILPCFYADKKKWITIMKNAIAYNASYFNTHRMVREYVLNAYF